MTPGIQSVEGSFNAIPRQHQFPMLLQHPNEEIANPFYHRATSVSLQRQRSYSLTMEDLQLLLIQSLLFPVLLCILQETPNHQDHDNAKWEGTDNAYRLNIVHATLGEDQCDRKHNQQQTPQKCNCCVRFFIFSQLIIAITCRCVCDRIEACILLQCVSNCSVVPHE